MSGYEGLVSIDRRFARSARIDADLGGTPPLAGYVMQASVEKALSTMASAQAESRQGAFTWTGPYGGGKSSAALLVASLVGGRDDQRRLARDIAGDALSRRFDDAFPAKDGRWTVVAVTGSRVGLRQAIAEACERAMGWPARRTAEAAAADADLVAMLTAEAEAGAPVLLVLDELGKLLEHEAATGGDAHLLQDLAERASRSDGRLVVVGILHQAFDQYAERADRDSRREWAKVQGRFHDVPFLAAADETVALLGRAITSKPPAGASAVADATALAVSRRRPAEVETLSGLLAEAWPLNPVTALLLGPVSRQRFAQNERSVFGFLSSAEPAGFQEFLVEATVGETYDPARLWDYLAANFGMALASGPDGARFSLAFEAIERAGARGGALHVALTKSAAAIEFFRNGSGLSLADDFLRLSIPEASEGEISAAVGDLLEWAVLIRQPRLGGYALFAGSDFDLDEAIARTTQPLGQDDLAAVPGRIGLGSISAKRHYFETGTLRTFDVSIALVGPDNPVEAVVEGTLAGRRRGGGNFVLLLGDGSLSDAQLDGRAKRIAKALGEQGGVAAIGASRRSYRLRADAEELFAIERVLRDHPQLEGDRIARREISARIASTEDALRQLLEEALVDAGWRLSTCHETLVRDRPVVVASALAKAAYPDAPVIRSELLQRDRPSSSAMAALRELCRAMVSRGDQADLGFEGYPAERGLYLTTLLPLGLHRLDKGGLVFGSPSDEGDGATLRAAWRVLADGDGSLADVFATWSLPPFGMKAGIMPVIALAFLLASREHVALYVDDVFQSEIDDLVVDRLLQKPAALRLRKLDRSVGQTAFLGGLAEALGLPGTSSALPVAQALFRRFAKLQQYSKRTARLPSLAIAVRDAVLRSNDPETLLFEALPAALGEGRPEPALVAGGLAACEAAYASLLAEVRTALARALGADAGDFHGVARRAESIRNLTNDFAFEAFCTRAAAFDGDDGDLEGLASLLVHKPAHSWSDRDREQALLELAKLGRRFREAEALASVRDRRSSTEAMALVVGVDPLLPPLLSTFELTEEEKLAATALADDLIARLSASGPDRHLRLAALARAVASVAGEREAA